MGCLRVAHRTAMHTSDCLSSTPPSAPLSQQCSQKLSPHVDKAAFNTQGVGAKETRRAQLLQHFATSCAGRKEVQKVHDGRRRRHSRLQGVNVRIAAA